MIHQRGTTVGLLLAFFAAFLLLAGQLSTDATPISPRSSFPTNYQSTDNDNVLASVQARRGMQVTGALQSRNDLTPLREKSLVKRGLCTSSLRNRPDAPEEQEEVWNCSPNTPSLGELVTKIQEHGLVGTKNSAFYTALGGKIGMKACKARLKCLGIDYVMFDDFVDPKWFSAQGKAIRDAKGDQEVDVFQKRLSQAFAEASKGDVYFCTRDHKAADNVFDQQYAWGGWEYPALTRNGDVSKVLRFDPSNDTPPRPIWQQGDPTTPNEPRG
ncbi:MAG: hypothetical protein Q9169_007916 [Polycauliona sp. 2 TL-2023]